ncbi:hypothetical protein HYFRA_00010105 [Hymenoscyphus fraxineus]|uniref:FAS1 domain-containing protein n=1 Tax=Hymenoscyphus fraxineus TaxID=746836 RepID=A0A9N9PNK9_9HELO|nr:hypothetical protein HYFRA_00010105 [Hymenoscyphus fraxineus]
MKLTTTVLPFVALSTAIVIPDGEIAEQLALLPGKHGIPQSFLDRVQGTAKTAWSGIEGTLNDAIAFSENAIDSALDASREVKEAFECHMSMTKFDMPEWLSTERTTPQDLDIFDQPQHRPHRPHHPPHHDPHKKHEPNQTVYQLIASSKYTTKLAGLINKYPDLVKTLNGTAANYTVFAPIDKAFEKIPKHHHEPSEEQIKRLLTYHVSPDFYPAGRVLVTHTIPTALNEPALGDEPQRLRVGLSLSKALNVNFYARIIAIDIFGTNGVIHGIDSLLLPPPPAYKIVELFPGTFSTLQLGLVKTGLAEAIEKAHHVGGTLFAPSNFAFQKLGPKINAFLFSRYGEKYLKALLEYHVVANQTLYSDAFYKEKSSSSKDEETVEDIPKGLFHIDLPTLLKERSLSIDVARYGGFITIKINGFSSVAIQDGLAKDGVVHVVNQVLIPPKTPGGRMWEGEEMGVEEFKERIDGWGREL